ncbi:MAG: GTPase Era [Anaerolineae bacterium]|nr:GTPase Era [Anaerolineae bacterium]
MTDSDFSDLNDHLNAPAESPLEEFPAGHRSGFVAVIGRPNVGKSTLMNGLLGQKVAIVSSKPQTTRVQQLGILTRPDSQIVFVDTPGLHKPRHELGKFMVDVAQQALNDADVIMFMVEAQYMPGPGDSMIAEQIKTAAPDVPVILVINKIDITPAEDLQKHVDAYVALVQPTEWIAISAQKLAGLEDVHRRLIELLPEGPRYYPPEQVTDMYTRTIAAEIIREKVLRNTHDEVPHAVAVEISEFKERDNNVTYIAATVYIERDTQKAIIIGKGGQKLRKIGTAARHEIEPLVGGKVFLELWVKVLPNWRQDENLLRRLGYRIR